ncbi:uncharacterized protein LOC133722096 isoform X2 [Rosa rugosa]|uniref:uncharacterized protein LOC133722096 isoform X2 n=1 Tax=Rosa rugosa TaxID=74645 RepID=UPI002B416E4A|nr:uncharacterized protein LOC133722096 isoform X2 [Rosa rugosa]
MASSKPVWVVACILWLLFLMLPSSSSSESPAEYSLVIGENATLQLSNGVLVQNSPGAKPGTSVLCGRVHVCGLSRLKYLEKFADTVKVKISTNSSFRIRPFEVCFHRNTSRGIGMCPHSQWEKVSKGSWSGSMSPYERKLLDIRTVGSSLESFEVSLEEEFFISRLVFFVSGVILMSLAPSLSNSLVFYYGSGMAIGVVLVLLIVLFQGMKLLPTGRKSSLGIFLFSSVVGLGSFLLSYIPGLLRSVLTELGISEEMYNPLAIFLLAFIFLAGAWLGFWTVRKMALREDGSIDSSTSLFVLWTIRFVALLLLSQSSGDPLLAAGAITVPLLPFIVRKIAIMFGVILSFMRKITIAFGTIVSFIARTIAIIFGGVISSVQEIFRWIHHRRMYRKLLKSPKKKKSRRSEIPDSPPSEYAPDEVINEFQSDDDYKFPRPGSRNSTLASCISSGLGSRSASPSERLYPSYIHTTPERRAVPRHEWESITRHTTEKALEELASSPDFGKWVVANADRISITPLSSRKTDEQRRSWFF